MEVWERGLASASVLLCALASLLSALRLLRPARWQALAALSLAAGAIVPSAAVLAGHGLRAGRFPAFGYYEVLSLYGLTVLATYVYTAVRHHMAGLSVILLPYATALFGLAAAAAGAPVAAPAESTGIWITLHAAVAFLGYGLCTTAGGLGAAYLIQDFNLKRKHFGASFETLPALEALDHLMARQIGAAFLLLTLALAAGIHLVRLRGGGAEWAADPKIVATGVTWGIYALLMHMRTNRARHGRRMALITLVGLLLLLFSFLGIHLVAESQHDFVLAGWGMGS